MSGDPGGLHCFLCLILYSVELLNAIQCCNSSEGAVIQSYDQCDLSVPHSCSLLEEKTLAYPVGLTSLIVPAASLTLLPLHRHGVMICNMSLFRLLEKDFYSRSTLNAKNTFRRHDSAAYLRHMTFLTYIKYS